MIRLLTIAFLLMAALPLAATARAEPEVTVTLDAAPTEVRVGEPTRLEVRVRARGGSIQNLELSDLKKYPELEIISHQTVRPMQFSFGFGSGVQKESSLSNIYVLRPTVAGTYEFGPAVAKVDGKIYRSAPLTLVVHPRERRCDWWGRPSGDAPSDRRCRADGRALRRACIPADGR